MCAETHIKLQLTLCLIQNTQIRYSVTKQQVSIIYLRVSKVAVVGEEICCYEAVESMRVPMI